MAFECICNTGYTGILCDQIAWTSCEANGCANGNCIINPLTGIYNCQCKSDGYTGTFCEFELCNPPCKNGGLCKKDNNGNPYCSCINGLTGTACEIIPTSIPSQSRRKNIK